ncbi:hypothetical protein [Rhodococcus sp. 1168]|uniref:hypothetical protein n=1 Tax=Rhodococcus sp. 1168 TaxID=2018041 RepID=UPI001592D0D2|nr:hypothetical protein [Rhodococcus sp. 1168]
MLVGGRLQLTVIMGLAALGTMLLVVGALGSGIVILAVTAEWFWRLYRTGE